MKESEKKIISQYAETIIIKANRIRHNIAQKDKPHIENGETAKLISDISIIATTMQLIISIDQKL